MPDSGRLDDRRLRISSCLGDSLAPLFRPDLARWELTREQLVHTGADQYPMAARWAEVIYREFEHIDGLTWTSHRCDPDLAYVFFGGRVAPADLTANGDAALILEDAALVRALETFAERRGDSDPHLVSLARPMSVQASRESKVFEMSSMRSVETLSSPR